MDSRSTQYRAVVWKRSPLAHFQRVAAWCGILSTMFFCGSGCIGAARQNAQLQNENSRLLAEYRAQRDRVTELQEKNFALEARVAESEKLLARVGRSVPESRISMRDNAVPRLPATNSVQSPPANSAQPFSSGTRLHTIESGDAANKPPGQSDLQWRPSRRKQ